VARTLRTCPDAARGRLPAPARAASWRSTSACCVSTAAAPARRAPPTSTRARCARAAAWSRCTSRWRPASSCGRKSRTPRRACRGASAGGRRSRSSKCERTERHPHSCNKCGGRGKLVKRKCHVCNGNKVHRGSNQVIVDIERGMPDGFVIVRPRARCRRAACVVRSASHSRLCLRECGARWRPAQVQERQGDQMPDLIPGDLRVTLRQLPHPIFRRNGDHLHMRLELTLTEARRLGRRWMLPSGAGLTSAPCFSGCRGGLAGAAGL